MGTTAKICLVFTLCVVAASGLSTQLMQQFLHPSPAQCQRSSLLRSLGLCDQFGAEQGEHGGEREMETEVEREREPTEREQEFEGEPTEHEIERESEQEIGENETGEQEFGERFQQRSGGDDGTVCGPGKFSCVATRKCIYQEYVCNGLRDCNDGSDERYCPMRGNMRNSRPIY